MTSTAPETTVVRVLRDGQLTIPAEFRRQLGIKDETLLQVTLANGELRIAPVSIDGLREESDWLDALYHAYEPIRARIRARGIPEEEINADIDAAIAEVRAEQDASRS